MALRKPGRHYRKVASAATTGADPLELEIQSRIKAELERVGCTVSSTSQTRRSTVTSGLPDLYAQHAAWGVRAWIEVKQPGQAPSKVQREWHATEREAGGIVLVVTSAADALEQFAALPRRRPSAVNPASGEK